MNSLDAYTACPFFITTKNLSTKNAPGKEIAFKERLILKNSQGGFHYFCKNESSFTCYDDIIIETYFSIYGKEEKDEGE